MASIGDTSQRYISIFGQAGIHPNGDNNNLTMLGEESCHQYTLVYERYDMLLFVYMRYKKPTYKYCICKF